MLLLIVLGEEFLKAILDFLKIIKNLFFPEHCSQNLNGMYNNQKSAFIIRETLEVLFLNHINRIYCCHSFGRADDMNVEFDNNSYIVSKIHNNHNTLIFICKIY